MTNDTLDLKELVDSKLKDIWERHPDQTCPTIPYIYQEHALKQVITFLALNPSLSPADKINIKNKTTIKPEFSMIDCDAKSPNQFYNKYFEIADKIKDQVGVKPNWTAIDLLYIRDSDQNKIKNIYNKNEGKNFIAEQVKLTLEVIEKLNPKIVIISNKLVQTILEASEDFIKYRQVDSNGVLRYRGIAFMMRESRFMGSRWYWSSTKPIGQNLKNKMYEELKRILPLL